MLPITMQSVPKSARPVASVTAVSGRDTPEKVMMGFEQVMVTVIPATGPEPEIKEMMTATLSMQKSEAAVISPPPGVESQTIAYIVGIGVSVGVGVGVSVGVGVGVSVGVGVGVSVGVAVGVDVLVGVAVGVFVGVDVFAAGCTVGVAVGWVTWA